MLTSSTNLGKDQMAGVAPRSSALSIAWSCMVLSVPELNRDFIHAAVPMQPPGPQVKRGREDQHQTVRLSQAPILGRGNGRGRRMGMGHAKTTLMAIPRPSLGCQLLPGIHQKPAATVVDRLLTGPPRPQTLQQGQVVVSLKQPELVRCPSNKAQPSSGWGANKMRRRSVWHR